MRGSDVPVHAVCHAGRGAQVNHLVAEQFLSTHPAVQVQRDVPPGAAGNAGVPDGVPYAHHVVAEGEGYAVSVEAKVPS